MSICAWALGNYVEELLTNMCFPFFPLNLWGCVKPFDPTALRDAECLKNGQVKVCLWRGTVNWQSFHLVRTADLSGELSGKFNMQLRAVKMFHTTSDPSVRTILSTSSEMQRTHCAVFYAAHLNLAIFLVPRLQAMTSYRDLHSRWLVLPSLFPPQPPSSLSP